MSTLLKHFFDDWGLTLQDYNINFSEASYTIRNDEKDNQKIIYLSLPGSTKSNTTVSYNASDRGFVVKSKVGLVPSELKERQYFIPYSNLVDKDKVESFLEAGVLAIHIPTRDPTDRLIPIK